MIVKRQIRNLLLICCILAIAVFWLSSEFHESVRAFRSYQASYSEITEPCFCQKKLVLFAEEELTDIVSATLENVVCRETHAAEFLRQLLALLFVYTVFLIMLLKRCMGTVYQFSRSPTCELTRILTFLQSADGRKKFYTA